MSRKNNSPCNHRIEWAVEFQRYAGLLYLCDLSLDKETSRQALRAEVTKLMAVELMKGVPPP